MGPICKICDCEGEPRFTVIPDVCDACAKFDWGRWTFRSLNWLGFGLGALLVLPAMLVSNVADRYAFENAAFLFFMLMGGAIGYAAFDWLANAVFTRFLARSAPSELASDRAKEAEKYFYISLLSAYQGKVRFAVSMLHQAKRHGWQRWERLSAEGPLNAFVCLPEVQAIVKRSR